MSQTAGNPAQTYEDYFVAHQFRPWAGELLDRAQPQPGERMLDLACGTGVVARLVAQRLDGQAQVTGLDLNPAMIEVARSTAANEDAEIEWHVGSADALPFPDATFDLVLIQQGLQFFPDRVAAVTEVHRVLVPGGRVATTTWAEIANNPLSRVLADVFRRHAGSSAMETPFALGGRAELHSVFAEAGFSEIEITVVRKELRFPSPERFLHSLLTARSAAIPALQALDEAERTRLLEAIRVDMAEPLRQFTRGDEVVYTTEAHIATARKTG